jgi:superfamily II DNA helicase RecQ
MTEMSKVTPTDVLGPGGMIAQIMPAYESRPQQLAMAELVAEAVEKRSHAIVEAPTGVGKSFAYLVPLALHALKNHQKVGFQLVRLRCRNSSFAKIFRWCSNYFQN